MPPSVGPPPAEAGLRIIKDLVDVAADLAAIVALVLALYWFVRRRRGSSRASLDVRCHFARRRGGDLLMLVHVAMHNAGEVPIATGDVMLDVWPLDPGGSRLAAEDVQAERERRVLASLKVPAADDRIFSGETNHYRFDVLIPPGAPRVLVRAFVADPRSRNGGGWVREIVAGPDAAPTIGPEG